MTKAQPPTERQMHIAIMSFSGLTHRNIGRRLGITRSTVRAHLQMLYRKLDTRNAVDSIRVLVERDIIEMPDVDIQ